MDSSYGRGFGEADSEREPGEGFNAQAVIQGWVERFGRDQRKRKIPGQIDKDGKEVVLGAEAVAAYAAKLVEKQPYSKEQLEELLQALAPLTVDPDLAGNQIFLMPESQQNQQKSKANCIYLYKNGDTVFYIDEHNHKNDLKLEAAQVEQLSFPVESGSKEELIDQDLYDAINTQIPKPDTEENASFYRAMQGVLLIKLEKERLAQLRKRIKSIDADSTQEEELSILNDIANVSTEISDWISFEKIINEFLIASKFQTTAQDQLQQYLLKEVTPNANIQRFNNACNDLKDAIKPSSDKSDPNLAIKQAGALVLSIAKEVNDTNKIKPADLPTLTRFVEGTAKVVRNPMGDLTEHITNTQQAMSLNKQQRFWGKLAGAMLVVLGAVLLATAVLAISTGFGAALGVPAGMLGLKIIATGLVAGVGAGLAIHGFMSADKARKEKGALVKAGEAVKNIADGQPNPAPKKPGKSH